MSTSVDSQPEDRSATRGASDHLDPFAPEEMDDGENLQPYRSVSRMAIIAFVLTLLSILAFTSPPMAVLLTLTSLTLGLIARSAIRKYPDELIGIWPANLAILGSAVIMIGSITAHVIILSTEVPDGYTRISFRDLQNKDRNSRRMVSQRALDLNGEQIFLKGYVYPGEKKTNLQAFVLVRDRGTCCFGGQPKLTDMVFVKLEGDLRINYSWRLRKLGGIFGVDEENVRVGSINTGFYRLNADYLK